MLLDICLGNRTSWKILLFMSQSPGKGITRQQIRKHTRIGNKVLVKFLSLLKMFGIVLEEKQGRHFVYKMNLSCAFANQVIVLAELEKHQLNNLYFDALVVLRDFVYELTNTESSGYIRNVFVFGSIAKRTARVDSDIDVAVVTDVQSPKLELEIASVCMDIEKRFKRVIQVHFFTEKEFSSRRAIVEEINRDGIRIV